MADTKIIKSATEASAVIITQPSLNSTNTTDPNQVLENGTNVEFIDNEADVITNQPLMNNLSEEEQNQKQRFSQFNPGPKPLENVQQTANEDNCTWCCFACTDCACDCAEICVDCGPCCMECCNDNGDCCAGCCDGGSGDVGVDGGDVAGCLECCGACFECCND